MLVTVKEHVLPCTCVVTLNRAGLTVQEEMRSMVDVTVTATDTVVIAWAVW